MRNFSRYRDDFETEGRKRLAGLHSRLSLLGTPTEEKLQTPGSTATITVSGVSCLGTLEPSTVRVFVASGYPLTAPLVVGSPVAAKIQTLSFLHTDFDHNCVYPYLVERSSAVPANYIPVLATTGPLFKPATVEKFERLVHEWKRTRNTAGSLQDICMSAAYQQIIGMGKEAVPLILRELERELDHWFWALAAINAINEGENPVPASDVGNLKLMASAWLNWGRQNGYMW